MIYNRIPPTNREIHGDWMLSHVLHKNRTESVELGPKKSLFYQLTEDPYFLTEAAHAASMVIFLWIKIHQNQ